MSPTVHAPVADEANSAEWDRFVETATDASGYHAWAWRGIFDEAFGHETRYLAARRDGAVVGVLPLVLFRSWLFGRFVVSLPFVNYGGVLARSDEDAQALVAAAARIARESDARSVELRHVGPRCPELPRRTHKVAMVRHLPREPATAWAGLDRKIRNQVRKAERSGLSIERGGLELLDAFYRVFAHNMRDLGTPVYARRFFELVLTRLGDRARCVVVRHGGAPVAAAVTLAWRDTLEVPWASSLKASRALCANTLLYWTLLQDAMAAGHTRFDFGRSSPDSGTFAFKQQWGAEPVPLSWEYILAPGRDLPNLTPGNPRFSAVIEAWKRLPLPVATAIGPHIVRSIP